MEELIKGLQETDVKSKSKACEGLQSRLNRKPQLNDLSGDIRLKLMNCAVELLNESNPKIVMIGFDAVQVILEHNADAFAPLLNFTFDTVLARFTDNKAQVRNRAVEMMVQLINVLGLSSGFEKLNANFSHKNYRVREHVLHTVLRLYEVYEDDIVIIPNLCSRVASLLGDSLNSLRTLAVDTLVRLHVLYGDSMLVELESNGIKATQLRMVEEGIASGTTTVKKIAVESPIRSGSDTADVDAQARIISPGSPQYSTTSHPQPGATAPAGASAAGITSQSLFLPSSFMSLLEDGPAPVPHRLYHERDLQTAMDSIASGLARSDDWQLRIKALSQLQGLVCGDWAEFEGFPTLLRNIQELIGTQITDLRSIVSKEACRTVGFLAVKMTTQFAPLSEFFFVKLVKQTAIKIQVMFSAADRCIRIIVASCLNGFPKLLLPVIEQCSVKTPALRKCSLEYLCIMCALWKTDVFERHLPALKSAIRNGVVDADPAARRASRYLFWVLHDRYSGVWRSQMMGFLQQLEPASQKHINAEKSSSTSEFQDLMELVANPSVASQYSLTSTTAVQSNSTNTTNTSTNIHDDVPLHVSSKPLERESSLRSSVASRQPGLPTRIVASEVKPVEIDNALLPPSSASSRRLSMSTTGAMRVAVASHQPVMDASESDNQAQSSVGARLGPSRRQSILQTPLLPSETAEVVSEPTLSHESQSSKPFSAMDRVLPSRIFEGTARRIAVNHPSKPTPVSDAVTSVDPKSVKSPPAIDVETVSNAQVIMSNGSSDGATRSFHPRSEATGVDAAATSAQARTDAPDLAPTHYSFDSLKAMVEDHLWSTRLTAFEYMHNLLLQQNKPMDSFLRVPDINSSQLEIIVELCIQHGVDAHQKVAAESLAILSACMERFTSWSTPKLGNILLSLFQRLSDRRAQIREGANEMLNNVRTFFEPVVLLTSLAPRIADIPERLKAALLQFLGATVPHCESYFSQAQLTWAFLGRMANILGANGSKPSTNVVIAGRRLLELVYKACPQVICAQLAALPLQQQTVLKKLLEHRIPDIDAIIANTSRADWNSRTHVDKEKLKTGRPVLDKEPSYGHSSSDENLVTGQVVNTKADIRSASKPSSARPTSGQSSPNKLQSPSGELDMVWLLTALRSGSPRSDLRQAADQISGLALNGTEEFWEEHCAQVISVLLDAFTSCTNALQREHDGEQESKGYPLTGLSPKPPSKTAHSTSSHELVTVVEHLHLACSLILLIVKKRGSSVKGLMELAVMRICACASIVPVAVTLQCESILSELGPQDPVRCLRILLPLIGSDSAASLGNDTYRTKLLTLRGLVSVLPHLTATQVISHLQDIVGACIPHISSSVVDLRQAVVLVLVEVYLVIGDALFPAISSLSIAHHKLLTIYINKRVNLPENSSHW